MGLRLLIGSCRGDWSDSKPQGLALRTELDGSAEQYPAAAAGLEDGLAQSRKALKERSDEVSPLRSKLDSMADYGEVKRELEIMRIVEVSSGREEDDDNGGDTTQTQAKPLEALLLEKNKKLQDNFCM